MEIRIYNENLEFKGIIENHSSLIWNRKYSDVGSFELHAPLTKENTALLKPNNLVWIKGNKEAGVIENLFLAENNSVSKIMVKGRFLESYFERRITKQTQNINSPVESAMRSLISSCLSIPKVSYASEKGYIERIAFQATYKNLLVLLKKISRASGIGFRLTPNFKEKTLIFESYKGIDRSLAQSERSRVIFSDEYNNLTSSQYTFSNQKSKTLAVVGGEGEGSQRTYVTVGEGSGLALREIFVDARDLRSEGISLDAYKELLREKGREVLKKSAVIESLECEVIPEGNFAYKKHYDLGDIVTIKNKKWGIFQHLRITEIQEIYEQEHVTIVPIFGNPLPSTLDLEK